MSNLVSNPNVSGELLSGLANDLIFEVVPFDCSGNGCETTRLRCPERGGVYASSWSVNKKDSHLAETNWRVRVSLDTGNGNDPVPLAYRDVFLNLPPPTSRPTDRRWTSSSGPRRRSRCSLTECVHESRTGHNRQLPDRRSGGLARTHHADGSAGRSGHRLRQRNEILHARLESRCGECGRAVHWRCRHGHRPTCCSEPPSDWTV